MPIRQRETHLVDARLARDHLGAHLEHRLLQAQAVVPREGVGHRGERGAERVGPRDLMAVVPPLRGHRRRHHPVTGRRQRGVAVGVETVELRVRGLEQHEVPDPGDHPRAAAGVGDRGRADVPAVAAEGVRVR